MGATRRRKSYGRQTAQKIDFTVVQIAWVEANQISTANFIYENDQCIKINTVVHFEIETPTNMTTTYAI